VREHVVAAARGALVAKRRDVDRRHNDAFTGPWRRVCENPTVNGSSIWNS
jgi:hypothetical protein